MKIVVRNFDISGDFIRSRALKTGHINDTYLVYFRQQGTDVPYLFQRINDQVFKNPPELMDNIIRVTGHIRQKLLAKGVKDWHRRVLTVILTKDGKGYYLDEGGNYWRAYRFIAGAKTFDTLLSAKQAFQIARAFGAFLDMLSDFPVSSLNETIKDFHNGNKRYMHFLRSMERDTHNRARLAKREIRFLIEQEKVFDGVSELLEMKTLTPRAAHNDTKINNVLLDDISGEGICVLDLDTVMPGLVLYDFGDLARTALSPAAEDEPDLTKVTLEISKFKAILAGFMSTAGKTIEPVDYQHLVFGIQFMTLIIGCRFLTDFLEGDVYFKVQNPEHNLCRCRTQFRLVELIQQREEELQCLVESYCEST